MDRLTLRGHKIFVTGRGRGIGFAICKAVALLGGDVAVIGALSKLVEEFHTLGKIYGDKTFYQKADVTGSKISEIVVLERSQRNRTIPEMYACGWHRTR